MEPPLTAEPPVSSKFPWNVVKGWSVTSRADGSLLIKPEYVKPYKGSEEGGGPGMFTRMALTGWILNRITKRRLLVRRSGDET